MKISKEELKKKIDELVENEDNKISLLEDIEDSMEVEQIEDTEEKVTKEDYDLIVEQLEELKQKYKERFLKVEEILEEKPEETKVEELTEEEIIDVKEI